MKRDITLIREILLWTEKQDHGYIASNPDINNYTKEQIAYHVYLMHQSGLVDANDEGSFGDKSPNYGLVSLTSSGHNFIANLKDETVWAKAKKSILKTTPGITLDLFLVWAKAEMEKKLLGS